MSTAELSHRRRVNAIRYELTRRSATHHAHQTLTTDPRSGALNRTRRIKSHKYEVEGTVRRVSGQRVRRQRER
jgi:hypothetical protein